MQLLFRRAHSSAGEVPTLPPTIIKPWDKNIWNNSRLCFIILYQLWLPHHTPEDSLHWECRRWRSSSGHWPTACTPGQARLCRSRPRTLGCGVRVRSLIIILLGSLLIIMLRSLLLIQVDDLRLQAAWQPSQEFRLSIDSIVSPKQTQSPSLGYHI